MCAGGGQGRSRRKRRQVPNEQFKLVAYSIFPCDGVITFMSRSFPLLSPSSASSPSYPFIQRRSELIVDQQRHSTSVVDFTSSCSCSCCCCCCCQPPTHRPLTLNPSLSVWPGMELEFRWATGGALGRRQSVCRSGILFYSLRGSILRYYYWATCCCCYQKTLETKTVWPSDSVRENQGELFNREAH